MILCKVISTHDILLVSVISTSILIHPDVNIFENSRVNVNIGNSFQVFFSHICKNIQEYFLGSPMYS